MRPARSGEVPAFGSIWQWAGSSLVDDKTRYLVIALLDKPGASMVYLLAVGLGKGVITGRPMPPELRDGMAWGFRNRSGDLMVTLGWECIDEGPHA